MVHERDDQYESQDDSEYHFTDDQANYELEADITSPAETVTPKKPFNFKEMVTQYKRPLIGASVFIVLIFLVYKIMSPATPQQPSDFTPGVPVEKAQVVKPVMPQQSVVAQPTTPPKPEPAAFQPLSQPLGMSGSTPTGVALPPKTLPAPPPVEVSQSAPVPPEVISPVQTQQSAPTANLNKPAIVEGSPPSVAQPRPGANIPSDASPQPPVIIANETPPPPIPVSTSTYNPLNPADQVQYEPTEIAKLNQKLVTVTQQNAQIHSEYSQKIAEYETQNSALQDKVKDLNNRIAGLESTIVRLGKSLQDQKESNREYPVPQSYRAEPRINYTVQAIIPGRAWLKSESGETVTVAEGDSLKGYGRIIKIDPYDGVVQIDVGGRLASLTYGVSTE